MKHFIDNAINDAKIYILAIITVIFFYIYSFKFIELQLKLFPKLCTKKKSRYYNWIPLAISYFIILKTAADFDVIKSDFTDIVILSVIFPIICWELMGAYIIENKKD